MNKEVKWAKKVITKKLSVKKFVTLMQKKGNISSLISLSDTELIKLFIDFDVPRNLRDYANRQMLTSPFIYEFDTSPLKHDKPIRKTNPIYYSLEKLKFFVEILSFNPNVLNSKGETPLFSENINTEVILYLVNHGIDPLQTNFEKENLLFYQKKDIDVFKFFCEKFNFDLSHRDIYGYQIASDNLLKTYSEEIQVYIKKTLN
jgi:hypothetical protein